MNIYIIVKKLFIPESNISQQNQLSEYFHSFQTSFSFINLYRFIHTNLTNLKCLKCYNFPFSNNFLTMRNICLEFQPRGE